MKAYIHRDVKPGALLRYNDDRLHLVSPSGNRLNVVQNPDGTLSRPRKLTKKERRRLVAA